MTEEKALPPGMTPTGLLAVLICDELHRQGIEDEGYRMVACMNGVVVEVEVRDGWEPVAMFEAEQPSVDEIDASIEAWNGLPQVERHDLFLRHGMKIDRMGVMLALAQLRAVGRLAAAKTFH